MYVKIYKDFAMSKSWVCSKLISRKGNSVKNGYSISNHPYITKLDILINYKKNLVKCYNQNKILGRKRNVEHWIGHPNFDLINHDIVNPLYIEVDEIYHLGKF